MQIFNADAFFMIFRVTLRFERQMPSELKFLQFSHGACQPQAQIVLFLFGIQWESRLDLSF